MSPHLPAPPRERPEPVDPEAFRVPDTGGEEQGTPTTEAFPDVPGTFPEQSEEVFRVPDPLCEEQGTLETGLFFDMAALLAGGIPDPPEPAFGRRDDGVCLFYAGQVNVVFGDPESGKTWIALSAAVDALADGGKVLLLDLDHNGPEATAERLLSLGARPEWIASLDRFRYVEPEDSDHIRRIVRAAVEWRPEVAVVDSVGELLPALGLSSNSPDDWTLGHTRVLKPLAMAGAAVIAIDHLAKNSDSRASGPTGTAAKRRAVGGVSLRVTVREAFTPGRGGSAAITINKDRHGGLRKRCPPPDGRAEAYAGTFTLDSSGAAMDWAIKAPTANDHAPGHVSRADLTELAHLDPPPASVRDVKKRLGWGSDRASDAFRLWRSSVPDPLCQEQGTPCTVCGFPLHPAAATNGQTTHPTCDPEGAA